MIHADHVNLLRGGTRDDATIGGVWADFGSGSGAFTLALADLIGPTGVIHSIDRDADALKQQARSMRDRFPTTLVYYHTADFTCPLPDSLPALDGIVMANALHFHRDQEPIVRLLKSYLSSQGKLILVEYNIEQGNSAVPYPISYGLWGDLAKRSGFTHTRLLATRPSRFLKEIYSAVSW